MWSSAPNNRLILACLGAPKTEAVHEGLAPVTHGAMYLFYYLFIYLFIFIRLRTASLESFPGNPRPESSHGLAAAVCFIGGEPYTPPQMLEEAQN